MRNKLLLFLLLVFYSANSQWSSIDNANLKYDKLDYFDAISLYEHAIKNGKKSVDVFMNLANAYYFNSEFEKAEKWYSEVFRNKKKYDSEFLYRYAQCLKSAGKYSVAADIMQLFIKKQPKDLRAINLTNQSEYLKKIETNSYRFIISNCNFNTPFSDYGTTVFDQRIYFSSAIDSGFFAKRKHKWTNQNFTNIYSTQRINDSLFAAPIPFNKVVNSKFHESTPLFTKDGTTVYFTRNNFNNGKKGKDKSKTTLLKIYKATWMNDHWDSVMELPFTSDDYTTAHPALSPDEKTLYFASDMPGTYGESDIFCVAINPDGTFGKPKNLGKKINTEGKETFPFISAANELYFASDGHPGLGGLDLFVSKITSEEQLNTPMNIGKPVNSGYDDFGFYMDSATKTGFFSSNRKNGKGLDDIYQFTEINPLTCDVIFEGILTDSNNQPIPSMSISIYDTTNKLLKVISTSANGFYQFKGECETSYRIELEKEGFESAEHFVQSTGFETSIAKNIQVTKQKPRFKIGQDLALLLSLNKILFDLDQSVIREDAAIELNKIVQLLNEYPTIKIDIRSHTDSRESENYNLKLSQRRAKATLDWLVINGIEHHRLTATGYGESQLLNGCADLVLCTEEQHQENRRSEFIITEL